MQADFNGAFSSNSLESEKNCEDFLALTLKKLDTFINSATVDSNHAPRKNPIEFESYAYGKGCNNYKMTTKQLATLHPKKQNVRSCFELNNLSSPIKHSNGTALGPVTTKPRLAKGPIKGLGMSAWNDKNTKFFVIKSNSAQNIQISQQHDVWASTKLGNARLSKAFEGGNCNVILFYSVCGSGSFCGVCKMMSDIKSKEESKDVWSNKEIWTRNFAVKWMVSKVVPNNCFRHLSNPENENKPVYQSRDTQVIPFDVGIAVLNIMESFPPTY